MKFYRNYWISPVKIKDYEEIWDKLFATGNLVRKIGTMVAENLGYVYPMQDDNNVTEYLQKIRRLPKGAVDFE